MECAPEHPQTLHLLGVLLQQTGRPQEAVELIERAIALQPAAAAFHNNLGNALKDLGQLEAAEDAYLRALQLRPAYAGALVNLAGLLEGRGEREAAVAHYRSAIELDPTLPEARLGLAHTLQAQGNATDALACLEEAISGSPTNAQAYFDLGSLLRQQGRLDRAAAALRTAIRLRPDWAQAHCNLGAVLQSLGDVEAAVRRYQRALALDPELGEAHFNLGNGLQVLGLLAAARASYERALDRSPKIAVEVSCYLVDVAQQMADWQGYEAHISDLVERLEDHLAADSPVALPMLSLNALPLTNDLRARIARQQSRLIHQSALASVQASARFSHYPAPTERLRIGYVSPDFREHAVGSLIRDLFALHDRRSYEVFAYSLHAADDPINRQVRAGSDHYADIANASTVEAAQRIHADGIHILVDLAGHTTFSRPAIFALQPAPVQLHYLGYLDTMGADFLPYTIADHTAITPEIAAHFSEAIIYMPHTFAVGSRFDVAQRTPTRAECGLPDEAFVYCCFNRFHKIDPQVFAAWMEILERVPQGVLWLYAGESAEGRANLRHEAERAGVEPDRLVFAARTGQPDYLARYRLADLLLDTFVYNGGATTIGALWAGLPVLTRCGTTFLSRMGASLCRAAGLDSMVCSNTADYVDRAVELASQRRRLADLRRGLIAHRSTLPLFDTPRFVRQLERAYTLLWADAVAGVGPRPFDVPDDTPPAS